MKRTLAGLRAREIPVRVLRLVLDLEDLFNPPLMLEDYVGRFKSDPAPPRFRVVEVEVLTCPEDGEPITVSECGKCPKFFRRFEDKVLCKSFMALCH